MSDQVGAATDIQAFLDGITHTTRRADCAALITLMEQATGYAPVMWTDKIVGFGKYHYKYESGTEGDFFSVGFKLAKTHITVSVIPGFSDMPELMARLGKHKHGKSCLYINKLADVNVDVLGDICKQAHDIMEERYPHA